MKWIRTPWAISLYLTIFAVAFWFFGEFSTGFRAHLYNWQELVGALIGATVGVGAPISLYIWQRNVDKRNRRREHLILIEKSLVLAINNLADVDRMLHDFLDGNFATFKQRVVKDNDEGRPSVGQTFVPLSFSFTLDQNLMKQSTESNYLENAILDVMVTSQELPTLLQDINRQFDRTIRTNIEIGLKNLNSPASHNRTLIQNLAEFESFIREQIFGHNIPVYLRKLVIARTALHAMLNWGLAQWQSNFEHLGNLPVDERSDSIREFFKPQTDAAINALRKQFKSKLFLSDEKSPLSRT